MNLIAVIDDDPAVRSAIERLLRAAGYRVVSYASGVEFLRSVEDLQAVCVAIDIHMPELTGFEILNVLREKSFAGAVVVLTADQDSRTRERALALGAAAFVLKPFDDTLLLDAIAAAVSPAPLPATPLDARQHGS
jgi:two-component system response regulator FixJ